MALTYILLTGASLSVASGYYHMLQQKKVFKLYESMERIQEYDFDYITQIQDLPLNKTIALSGEIDPETINPKQSTYNPRKKVVFSTVKKILPRDKKITKQILSDENESFDEYYNTINNHNLPNFTIRNTRQEKILVSWKSWTSVKEIGLFNIKPIAQKIDPAKIASAPNESPIDNLLALIPGRKKLEYGELGIEPDEKYIFIGELTYPDPKNTGGKKIGLTLVPRYIVGESTDFFRKYLDGQLVKLSKRTKKSFIIAGALASIHLARLLYHSYEVNQKRKKPSKRNE